MKQAIAILDAAGENGKVIAKALAKDHRLLLFGHDQKQLNDLALEVKSVTPQADLDLLGCAFEASWEADVVIMNTIDEVETADKIRQVTTKKLVIELAEQSNKNCLEELLPNSTVKKVSTASEDQMIADIRTILKTA